LIVIARGFEGRNDLNKHRDVQGVYRRVIQTDLCDLIDD
jgi:hypothetical protein